MLARYAFPMNPGVGRLLRECGPWLLARRAVLYDISKEEEHSCGYVDLMR